MNDPEGRVDVNAILAPSHAELSYIETRIGAIHRADTSVQCMNALHKPPETCQARNRARDL